MASWRGHLGGAVAFFTLPAGALLVAGGGESLLAPPEAWVVFTRRALEQNNHLDGNTLEAVWSSVLFLTVCLMGLFPDVDTSPSAGRRLWWSLAAALVLGTPSLVEAGVAGPSLWLIDAGLAATLFAAWRASHRGWTHSLWAAVLVPALIGGGVGTYFLGQRHGLLLAAGSFLGYFSHLWMDGLLAVQVRRESRRAKGYLLYWKARLRRRSAKSIE